MPSKEIVGLFWDFFLTECTVLALSNRRLTNFDRVIENKLQHSRPKNTDNTLMRVH
jgi:hypothetical protein